MFFYKKVIAALQGAHHGTVGHPETDFGSRFRDSWACQGDLRKRADKIDNEDAQPDEASL